MKVRLVPVAECGRPSPARRLHLPTLPREGEYVATAGDRLARVLAVVHKPGAAPTLLVRDAGTPRDLIRQLSREWF